MSELEPFMEILSDGNHVEVRYRPGYGGGQFDDLRERVDLSPNPAWPSPDEIHTMVAQAVSGLMEQAWNRSVYGSPRTCICDRIHPAAACEVHPTCQGGHVRAYDAHTYHLGHYEQMQIDLALQLLVTDDEEEYGRMLSSINAEALSSLRRLFASHGTVSITRTEG